MVVPVVNATGCITNTQLVSWHLIRSPRSTGIALKATQFSFPLSDTRGFLIRIVDGIDDLWLGTFVVRTCGWDRTFSEVFSPWCHRVQKTSETLRMGKLSLGGAGSGRWPSQD